MLATHQLSMTCQADELLGLAFLRDVARRDVEALTKAASSIRRKPGQTVVHEGDVADALYAVADGLARSVRVLEDGRRFITGLLFPGDVFGAAISGRHISSLETVTAARLCRLPHAALQRVPHIGQLVLNEARHELMAAQERMMLLGRKNARERVASFLLWLADHQQQHGGDGGRLWLPLSRTDLADYLGVAMETASRVMNEFSRSGIIAVKGSHVILLQPQGLRSLAAEA